MAQKERLAEVDAAAFGRWIRRFRKIGKGKNWNTSGDMTQVFEHAAHHEIRDEMINWFGSPTIDQPAIVVWWNDELSIHHRLEIYTYTCAIVSSYVWKEKKGILSWPFRKPMT